jgi:large subunit ribosomal protein L13
MKTVTPSPGDITHAWYVVDATGLALGRMSSQIDTLN